MRQGQEVEFDEDAMPGGGGIINLFGAAVLIWSGVIAAAIWMF